MTDPWGTIPQWISGVGGSASLLLALYILLRDRRKESAAQAALVACWCVTNRTYFFDDVGDAAHKATDRVVMISPGIGLHQMDVHLHNASDRPIHRVDLLARTMTRREMLTKYSKAEIASFGTDIVSLPKVWMESGIAPENQRLPGAVMPGETGIANVLNRDAYPHLRRRWLIFDDASGRRWCRDLHDNRLMGADSIRARARVGKGALRAAVFRREPFARTMMFRTLRGHD